MSNLELPFRSLAVVITGTSALLIMNIVSVIGNNLVCLAVYRNPNLRSTTNLYIIALAVSDLICATIEMPLASAVFIIGKWDFWTPYVRFKVSIHIMNIVSVIGNNLVCLAVYRNPNLRSTTNLYIIALAVSDLICATIEMPLASAVFIIGKWDFWTPYVRFKVLWMHSPHM